MFNENYIDIDIANCHPTITLQLAKASKLECSNLEYYVENRNEVLELVQNTYNVNRDIAKNLFKRLLYSGTFSKWATDNNIKEPELEFIKNIAEELKHLSLKFVNNNPRLRKRVYAQRKLEKKDTRKEKIIKSTTLYYLQEIENRILETIYQYCVENNIIKEAIACLCYDGIMIEKQYYNERLLDIFNELIINRFGLNSKFEQKEMTTYLSELNDT